MKKTNFILTLIAVFLVGSLSAQVTEKDASSRGDKTKSERTETTASTSDTPDKAKLEQEAQQMAKEMTTKMDEVLNLSADQEKKAMAANLQYARQMIEIKAKHRQHPEAGNETEAKAARERLQDAKMKEYKSFLTKDQAAKFNEHRDNLKDEKGEKMTKEEKKQKVEDMTPEERERLKKEKEEKKSEKSSN